eukprot:jgi/Tetstr1/441292/TSEL_029543.t1
MLAAASSASGGPAWAAALMRTQQCWRHSRPPQCAGAIALPWPMARQNSGLSDPRSTPRHRAPRRAVVAPAAAFGSESKGCNPLGLTRRGLLLAAGVSSTQLRTDGAHAKPVARNPAKELARMARLEPDPESAKEVWDQVVELDGGTAVSLYGRGSTLLKLREYSAAAADLAAAQPLLHDLRSGAKVTLPTGGTVPIEVVQEALALDGMGITQMHQGNAGAALDLFNRAVGVAGQAGASEADVPEDAPFAGLRGGPPSLGQRLELHRAMARFEGGSNNESVAALQAVDTGPNPDGFPQFWDARAALAIALNAAGKPGQAELEWADLCRPAPNPPPAKPTNPVYARVNLAAQTLLAAEGMMTDRNCEDYETGLYLPCDDAGIPGLGGSSAPCTLYTVEEAAARAWPPRLVAELGRFRAPSPIESIQNRARGVLEK